MPQLKLFSQLRIGEKFTFESPNRPDSDVRIKTSENISHHQKTEFGSLPSYVNGGVLVFPVPNSTVIAEFEVRQSRSTWR